MEEKNLIGILKAFYKIFTGQTIQHVLPTELPPIVEQPPEPEPERCPNCDISFEEIIKGSRIGCPHCYVFFALKMELLAFKLHGSVIHRGKVPKRWLAENTNPIQYIVELNKKLNLAICTEEYETASQIQAKLVGFEALRRRLDEAVKYNDLDVIDKIRKEMSDFIRLDLLSTSKDQ